MSILVDKMYTSKTSSFTLERNHHKDKSCENKKYKENKISSKAHVKETKNKENKRGKLLAKTN